MASSVRALTPTDMASVRYLQGSIKCLQYGHWRPELCHSADPPVCAKERADGGRLPGWCLDQPKHPRHQQEHPQRPLERPCEIQKLQDLHPSCLLPVITIVVKDRLAQEGTASEICILHGNRCVYGPRTIRHISDKSAIAVEIDLTWFLGFVFVELGRLPKPLSCNTLLICPICSSKVLIVAP
ncbi:hypothetical protein Tco_0553856 [Tanacetum coccineum]